MSNSPISVRVTPSNIGTCADMSATRWAMNGVQILPILRDESVAIGVKVDGTKLTERRPVNECYAVATDGIALAVTKLEGMAATPALCPAELLKKPAKAREITAVELNGQWKASTRKLSTSTVTDKTAPIIEGRFPPVKDILPAVTSSSVKLCLDASALARLAEVISPILPGKHYTIEQGKVTLIFDVSKDGTVDSPIAIAGTTGFGVIMPCNADKNSARDYRSEIEDFKHNLNETNTEERQQRVIELLNPDLALKETPVEETPVEEIPAEDPAAVAHRAKFDAICTAKAGHGEICLFPVGAEYHAYLSDAEPLAAALELSVSVEYPDTDHELKIATFKQADLAISFNKLARAGLFIHVCNAL